MQLVKFLTAVMMRDISPSAGDVIELADDVAEEMITIGYAVPADASTAEASDPAAAISDAHAQAEEIRTTAKQEAERMLEDARAEAHRILAEAEQATAGPVNPEQRAAPGGEANDPAPETTEPKPPATATRRGAETRTRRPRTRR